MSDDITVPSANEWGRKRVDFYVDATSRVREDGFLNDEEHELLELEEEDAVERQHKMDSINSVMDPTKLASFIDVSDDESSENDDDICEEPNTTANNSIQPRVLLPGCTVVGDSKPKKTISFKLPTTKQNSKPRKREEDAVDGWEDEQADELEDDGRRMITYKVQKNKGFIQKRKKEARHSRVKRRAQYKKALIKRRSQVPDVKHEMTKYSGESRGIRMSTVRSIPLKS